MKTDFEIGDKVVLKEADGYSFSDLDFSMCEIQGTVEIVYPHTVALRLYLLDEGTPVNLDEGSKLFGHPDFEHQMFCFTKAALVKVGSADASAMIESMTGCVLDFNKADDGAMVVLVRLPKRAEPFLGVGQIVDVILKGELP